MDAPDLMEDLAIPFFVEMWSEERDGDWVRHASFPELPGCSAQATTALAALDSADELRVRMIIEMHRRGERAPRPRPPLTEGLATTGTIDIDALLKDAFEQLSQN
jgi:predicted RNase H-like HicB family nuclease